MPNLIGTAPNQVPVNGLLGTMAFQDSNAVTISSGTIGGVSVATIADTVLRGEQLDTIASSSSLVLRGGATNLLTYSEQFDNASWTKVAVSIIANTVVSPDGSLSADLIQPTTASSTHYASSSVISQTSGLVYTSSVYAKAGGYRFLRMGPSNSNVQVCFDLQSGTVSAETPTGSGSIIPVGNGWYRCSTVATAIATTTASVFLSVNNASSISTLTYAGDGTSGIYVWGAQIEVASTVGAYLKTEATAVSTSYAAPIESPNGIAVPLIASMTPARNGDMTFQLTSNTSLTIKVKGSDGTVRSVALTLA